MEADKIQALLQKLPADQRKKVICSAYNSMTSPKKARAARRNGKKGGRPRIANPKRSR